MGLKAEDVLDRIKWKRDIRYGKSGVKGGGRVGQDKVEERYSKPFWRPQIMVKAREEETYNIPCIH